MHRLIIAGIGVLAVALLAAGCGGGGSDEAAAQVSKAEFFKRARAVCAKTQKRIQAVFNASNSISDVYSKTPSVLRLEAEELESLPGLDQFESKLKPLIANVLKASRLVAQQGEAAVDDPRILAYKREASALHLDEC